MTSHRPHQSMARASPTKKIDQGPVAVVHLGATNGLLDGTVRDVHAPVSTDARIVKDLAHFPAPPARQVQHLARQATWAVPFQEKSFHLVVPRANVFRALPVPGALRDLAVTLSDGRRCNNIVVVVVQPANDCGLGRRLLLPFCFMFVAYTWWALPRRLFRLGVEVVRLSSGTLFWEPTA